MQTINVTETTDFAFQKKKKNMVEPEVILILYCSKNVFKIPLPLRL